MKFCSVTISKILYPTLNNFTRRSLVAAEIAVLSYFADVKANIRILSERLIGEGLASHDEDIIAGAKIRRRSLVKFLRGRTPLSYGAHVYPDLMRSVNPAGHHMSLQVGDPKSMSSQEVAGLMYNMTKAINPIGLQPPFFPKSNCVGVFRVAVEFISRQASLAQIGDTPTFVKNILAMILDEQLVAHVPWSPPPNPRAIGRPTRKVAFDFYRSTSKLQEMGERAMMLVVNADDEVLLADSRLAASAALQDAKSPWIMNSLTIGEIPTILHKQTLPSDFSIAHASVGKSEPFVTETYEWAIKHYNGTSPIHKFALVAAHMFSRIAPKLAHPPAPSNLRSMPLGGNTITQHVRAARWIVHDGSDNRGVTASLPFIVMVTTTIMALMDEMSPLRLYMKDHHGSQGAWARKNGKSLLIYALSRTSVSCYHRQQGYQCFQPCALGCCHRTQACHLQFPKIRRYPSLVNEDNCGINNLRQALHSPFQHQAIWTVRGHQNGLGCRSRCLISTGLCLWSWSISCATSAAAIDSFGPTQITQ